MGKGKYWEEVLGYSYFGIAFELVIFARQPICQTATMHAVDLNCSVGGRVHRIRAVAVTATATEDLEQALSACAGGVAKVTLGGTQMSLSGLAGSVIAALRADKIEQREMLKALLPTDSVSFDTETPLVSLTLDTLLKSPIKAQIKSPIKARIKSRGQREPWRNFATDLLDKEGPRLASRHLRWGPSTRGA
jgi:hypothetical protein